MSKNQTIQHKRSTVSGNKPTTAQVEKGELAINFADRALYTQTAGGTIIELASDIFVGTAFAGTPVNGDMWYNTTDGMMRSWDGTKWTSSTQSGKPVLPANTTASVAFSSGAGTSASPYVFSATASAGDVKAINKITITNLVAGQYVPIVDLSSASNGGRFSVTNNIADASGTLVFVIMFTDAPTSGSGVSYTASFKVGTGTVYINPTMSIASVFPQTVNAPTGVESASTAWTAAPDTITATGSLLISTNNSTFSAGPLAVATGATLYTKWAGTAGSGTGIDGAHGSTITGGLSSSSGATSSSSLTIDKTPAAISFTSQTGVGLSAAVTSDTVTISGVNSYVYLTSSNTITAAIAGGTFNSVPASGTTMSIVNGQTLAIRQTSSATSSTTTTATINLNSITATFAVTTNSASVNTPTINSPLPAATGISLTPTITSSAYAVTGVVGAHLNTDWEIATNPTFTTGVVSLNASTTSLTSWSTGLALNTTYYVHVRYRSNDGTAVVSDWSPSVSFTTTNVNAFNTALALQAGDGFGYAVAISSDGNTMVATAIEEDGGSTNPRTRCGSFHVFVRTGTTWTHQAQLWGGDSLAYDQLGQAIKLSSDGNTLAVSAKWDDGPGDAIAACGCVYIFTRTGTTWTQQAQLWASDATSSEEFGEAIALSSDGNTLAVTTINEDGGPSNAIMNCGCVYVFVRSGSTWTQQAQLWAADRASNDWFGSSVAVSSDGNTLAVGATGEYGGASNVPYAGSVYIFTRSGTTWTQQAQLWASTKQDTAFFGGSVSLSSDGNTLAVGANLEDISGGTPADVGSVYIFTRSGTAWTQQTQLWASDRQAGDEFCRTALSSDGNTLAVGASLEDGNTIGGAGAVYIFTRSGTTWTQQAKLLTADTQADDRFGFAVALSSDGNTLVSGALGEGGGAGNTAYGAGAVYIFTRSGSTWTQQAQMVYSDGTNVGGVII